MRVLFDSNVLVAFLVKDHIDHTRALNAFLEYRNKDAELVIGTHSIAEVYRTLTWGVRYLNYTPQEAHFIITNSILPVFKCINLVEEDYQIALAFLNEDNLSGAIIYDALIACASEKAKVDSLVTFNIKDFKRVQPLTSASLIKPY